MTVSIRGIVVSVLGLLGGVACSVVSSTCELDRLEENGVSVVAFLRDSLTSDSRLWLRIERGNRSFQETLLETTTVEVGVCFSALALSSRQEYVGILVILCDGRVFRYSLDVKSGKSLADRQDMSEVYERARLLYGISPEALVWMKKVDDHEPQRGKYLQEIIGAYGRRAPGCRGIVRGIAR